MMSAEDRQRAVLAWLVAQPEDSSHSVTRMCLKLRMSGADARAAMEALVAKGDAYRYRENGAEVFCASAKAIREARRT